MRIMAEGITFLQFVLAGTIVGFLIGSVGVGGGSIMTPLLIQIFRFAPATAVATDLVYALITKIFATRLHHKQSGLDKRILMTVGSSGVVGALVGSLFFEQISTRYADQFDTVLRLLIGFLLVASAVINLWIRYRRKPNAQKAISMEQGRLSMIVVGFIVGVLITFTSVGAGALVMVFLLYHWHIPSNQVVGTGLGIALLIVAIASLSHMFITPINIGVTVSLIAGGMIGAYFGERFHRRIDEEKIKLLIIAILMIVGISMLIGGGD